MSKYYKGGYQLVDFGGVSLTADPVAVPGVYETIEGNYKKPLVFTGLVLDGSEKGDMWANIATSGGNYVATLSGVGVITVTNGDMVSFTAA